MLGTRLRRALPVALLVVLTAAVYAPLLTGQVLFQRDISRQIFPERAFLAHALASGDSLLWNPLLGLGLGTLDNPLNQLFYPPNLILVLFPSAKVISCWLFVHLLVGGVGMAWLARGLGVRSRAATLLAGLAWCLSGYCTAEFTAGLRLVAAAYLPWCGLAFLVLGRRLCEGANWRVWLRSVAVAAIPTGMMILGGEIFLSVMALAFGFILALVDGGTGGRRMWGRLVAAAALVGLLSAGLGAASVVPALRAAAENQRGQAMARATAEVGSFHPLRLMELAAPGALGNPYGVYPAGRWIGEPGLDGRPLIYGAYLGASVLALALMAFGRGRRGAWLLGVSALVALLAAMGRYTPVHAVLRWLLLPLAFMRGPEKYLVIFVTAMALLAALGLDRLRSGPAHLWRRSLLLAVPLALLALVAERLPTELATIRSASLAGLGVVLAVGAVAWLASRRPAVASVLAVAVVTLDLGAAVWELQTFGPARLLEAEPEAARAIRQDAQARGLLAPPRVHRLSQVDAVIEQQRPPQSVAEVQLNLTRTLIDNHVTSFGIANVPGYDAATPNSLRMLWFAGKPLDVLRLTGVEYLVAGVVGADQPVPPGFVKISDPVPGVRVLRLTDTLPRVYLVGEATPMPDAQARRALFEPDVLAGRRVIVDSIAPALAGQVRGACRLTRFANSRVEAECDSDGPALAVFLEQFDRGWRAEVDGVAVPCLRANLAMRAVPVTAGRHHLVLTYVPAGFALGLGLSILSIVGVVLVGASQWLRRRPEGPSVV